MPLTLAMFTIAPPSRRYGSAYFMPRNVPRAFTAHHPIEFCFVEVGQRRGGAGNAGGVHDAVDRPRVGRAGHIALNVRRD